jgi:hypothetical protein
VARMGEGSGVYRVLIGRPEGKRPLGRLRHRWEDNIKLGGPKSHFMYIVSYNVLRLLFEKSFDTVKI